MSDLQNHLLLADQDDFAVNTELFSKEFIRSFNQPCIIPDRSVNSDYDFLFQGADPNSSEEIRTIHGKIHVIESHPAFLRKVTDFEFLNQLSTTQIATFWKANDLRTGKSCVIKEFHSYAPSYLYLREIFSLAQAQNRFTVNFVGFTVTSPCSIIIESIQLGKRLSDLIGQTKISGTRLTIISLCLAYAMKELHRNGVILRDLNPNNIIIDKDVLPKILNFSLSRLESTRMSSGIGTVNYMAPEMFVSETYTNKVDVYSFGMLLYELSQKKRPFCNNTDPEIYKLVTRDKYRPSFQKKINKPLKKLIENCWSHHEEERPTFQEIFDLFAYGHVLFNNANDAIVKEFAQQLLIEKRNSIPKTMCNAFQAIDELKASLNTVNSNSIIIPNQSTIKLFERPIIRDSTQPHYNSSDFNYLNQINLSSQQILSNPINQSNYSNQNQQQMAFTDTLIDTSSLQNNTFGSKEMLLSFASTVPRVGGPHTNQFIENLIKMAESDNRYYEIYHTVHIFSLLQFTDLSITFNCFQLLFLMFTRLPSSIDQSYHLIVGYYLTQYPQHAIILFQQFALGIEKVKDPMNTLNFFISSAIKFLNIPEGVYFIRIIRYLLVRYPTFKDMSINTLRPILCSFIQSNQSHVVAEALKIVCELWDSKFVLPFNSMNNQIVGEDNCNLAISALLRVSHYPTEITKPKKSASNDAINLIDFNSNESKTSKSNIEKFIKNILKRALKNSKAFEIILKFIHEDEAHARIVMNEGTWRILPKTSFFHQLLIFLSFLKYDRLCVELTKTSDGANILKKLIQTKELNYILTVNDLFKKLDVDAIFLKNLSESGFLITYASIAKDSNNDSILNAFLGFFNFIIQKGYSADYQRLVLLPISLLNRKNEQSRISIRIISHLSKYPQMAQKLKTTELIQYFTSLMKLKEMRNIVVYFLTNIDKVKT